MDAATIKLAADQCKQHGVEVTVANVARNVLLKPGDYSALLDQGLKRQVSAGLRRLGYITNDEVENTKVEITVASLSDLRMLLRIKGKNIARSQKQYDALKALVDFLSERERELGYEPYVYQFEDDARRIYAMHGVELPRAWGRPLE